MMERFGIRWGSLLLLWAWAWTAVAQPGPRYHTDHKKAIKAYQKAVDAARAAMAPSADRSALEDEVESLLSKALALDPEFSEAERILAGFRVEQGRYGEALDLYRRYLSRDGRGLDSGPLCLV